MLSVSEQTVVAYAFLGTISMCLVCVLVVLMRNIFEVVRVVIRAIFVKTKNPLLKDTFINRLYESKCYYEGCITTGSYYTGMPQASCKRCGHKNRCAQEGIHEWRIPDHCSKNNENI